MVSDRLCECGCGQPTLVSAYTSERYGYVKGQPRRFRKGHAHRWKPATNYRRVTVRGRLSRIHRLRAERALGKTLPPKAVVHHADGSRSDDAPLVICQDETYHRLLHARMRIRAAGGNPDLDKLCTHCKRCLPRSSFYPRTSKYDGLHDECKDCSRSRARRWKAAHRRAVAS